MTPPRAALAALALAAFACSPRASHPGSASATSELRVAVEGTCPKLAAYPVGPEVVLAYGTYGLEDALLTKDRPEARAAQGLAHVRGDRLAFDPALLAGLPLGPGGYVRGDLEVGGRRPRDAWLVRVDTDLAPAQRGALFERRRVYYARDGARWTEDPKAVDRARPGARPPPLAEASLCEAAPGTRFARHATARIDSGDTVVAGRCEDELGRAQGGVFVATYRAGDRDWAVAEAPPSALWQGIVNLDVVFSTERQAYLYAYAPYDESASETYVAAWDGAAWRRLAVPFEGPIVSLSLAADGALWAVARFAEVHRRPARGAWARVPLPSPRWASPAPAALRVLEVQTTGSDAWVHAAYPIAAPEREDGSARGHVLFTTRVWGSPWFCDRKRPAASALSPSGRSLPGAVLGPAPESLAK